MKALAIFSFFFFFFSLEAARAASNSLDVASFEEVVDYYSKYVFEVERPFYVWHWFNQGGRNKAWGDELGDSSALALDYTQKVGRVFWKNLCSADAAKNPSDCETQATRYQGGNAYGSGLYAALDPVITHGYGESKDLWVLLQIRLPKGFRLMDIVSRDNPPPRIVNFMKDKGCGEIFVNPMSLMNPQSHDVQTDCGLTIRRIVKDGLKIDGFSYRYQTSPFEKIKCDGPFKDRAIVITSADRFSAADVFVFNQKTRDRIEERSLFKFLFESAPYARLANLRYMDSWSDLNVTQDLKLLTSQAEDRIVTCRKDPGLRPLNDSQKGTAK